MLYKRVYTALRESIGRGEYSVGQKLPSEAELSAEFSVSRITVKRALDMLRADGMVVRRPRIGTIVTSGVPVVAPQDGGGRSGTTLIGCVITDFDDTFGNKVIEGILAGTGVDSHVIVKLSRGDVGEEDACIRAALDAGVAGLVLLPSSSEYIPPEALELVTRRFPVVILDRVFDGVPISAVTSDNVRGGRIATEHLFDLGHENVGFIGASSHVSSTAHRYDGYVEAHARHHVPLQDGAELRSLGSTVPGTSVSVDDDMETLTNFLRERPGVTGYVVAEYNIALMLDEACRRLGLNVPGDISIVCFDHPDSSFYFAPYKFTHIRQDERSMGRSAVELVNRQLTDVMAIEKIVLPVDLLAGESTREQHGS